MAIFNGTLANDVFAGSAADDVFNYGSVTFNGATVIAGRGLDTISSGGGFDRLTFANLGSDYIDAQRVGNDLSFYIQPTSDWNVAVTTLGGVRITNFFAADGNGVIDRIDFSDVYGLSTYSAGIWRVSVYNFANVLQSTIVDGSAGNDSITGTALPDRVDGSGGNDTLSGLAGDDKLHGDIGNDLLIGGAGNDDLFGDIGNDRLVGGSGNDFLDGGAGIDTADFSFANGSMAAGLDDTASDASSMPAPSTNVGIDALRNIENLVGGRYADYLYGNGAANLIDGGAGDDTLWGNAGDDSLLGGAGADLILAEAGGIDYRGVGNDTYDGGAITDTRNQLDTNTLSFEGSATSVTVNLQTGVASNALAGTDTLRNFNAVIGSQANDTLVGSNRLVLETFTGAAGSDRIDGGAITDTLNERNSNCANFSSQLIFASVTVDLQAGTAVGHGNDTLIGINQVIGGTFADTLRGSNRSDVSESFTGMNGNDVIDGRGGLDIARYEYAGNGVTVNLAAGTAFVTATDHDTITNVEGIRGSNFNDTLTGGNAASNALEFYRGMGGSDTIDGGAGYDRVEYVNSVQGVVVTLGGAADGMAQDGQAILNGQIVSAGTAGATIGTDTLRHIEAVRGSDFNDTLTGSNIATQETFEGRAGNDVINGGGGADRAGYFQALASVTVTLGLAGAAGSAADGYGSTDTLRNIENVQGSRDFADRITGNELANVLDGQGGNDTLVGGAGNDTLLGGAGNDSLDGGLGNDSMVGGDGNDVYVVNSTGDRVTEAGTASSTADQVRSGVTWSLAATGNSAVERLTLTGSTAINGSGNSLANTIVGNAGANLLNGAAGNDTLTGGAGLDAFRFSTTLNASTNADRITDFVVADDTFQLDDAVFGGIGATGALAAAALRTGAAAGDADDRVIYNSATGQLFYDSDGSGAAAQVLFATLTAGTALSAADFVII